MYGYRILWVYGVSQKLFSGQQRIQLVRLQYYKLVEAYVVRHTGKYLLYSKKEIMDGVLTLMEFI